jgi:uncharacterized protein (TIGR03437 family)
LTGYSDSETTATLPLTLDNVTVSVDVPSANLSVPARLLHLAQLADGSDQIDIQMPWEVENQTSAQMKVTLNEYEPGNVVTVPVANYAPAFFHTAVDALDYPGNNVISATNPVARGGVAQLFAHGLGPVNNPPGTGNYVTDASATTTTAPVVMIGGQQAQVIFSGLAPNFPGEYQVNVYVPTNIGTGPQPISIAIGGVTSAPSYYGAQVVIPVKSAAFQSRDRKGAVGAVVSERPLKRQCPRARLLLGVGQVQRMAALATIDFGFRAELPCDLFAKEEPALQMAGAELVLGVSFVAGPHPGNAPLHLRAVAEGRQKLGDGHGLVRGCVLRVCHIEKPEYIRKPKADGATGGGNITSLRGTPASGLPPSR